jgi:acyl transferase domain-containing protein/SAM-dependent methyltransferase
MTQDGLSPIKRALLEIRDLRARLAEATQSGNRPATGVAPPIAIIGMAMRLPGGVNDDVTMERLLWSGTDAVGPIPQARWHAAILHDADPDAPGRMTTRHGAFLDDVDLFDADFFGISPREAASMDPQQRILLEVCWQALEDAGHAAAGLAGSRTGVYVGVSNSDYGRALLSRPERIDAYAASGGAFSVIAGRVSYCLGLRGPSLAVDTACSSSLVALHLACQALRAGECDMALVGGINLILTPELNITFTKARMMAPDGRCKAFDAAADGYVRGEGCGVLVLRRLEDAQAGNDRVLAVVRGSAVNQDGSSNGLTAPNGPAQEAVIRAALAQGGIAPSLVSYIEAHGTGTPLGDPIEAGALAAVFRQSAEPGAAEGRDGALQVGSVKTNLGHLEAAAGVAGVIKVILALRRRSLPPSLHFRHGNPRIDWDAGNLAVPTVATDWHPAAGRRIAGVSSFGFSGTNAHAVLEEAPPNPAPPAASGDASPWHLLPLSARDAATLRDLAARHAAALADGTAADAATLGDVCFTAAAGRTHFRHRLAVTGTSAAAIRDGLAAFAAGQPHPSVASFATEPGENPRIAFLITGDAAPDAGLHDSPVAAAPAFRQALEACAAILAPRVDPYTILAPRGAGDAPWTVPALFAARYAAAAAWTSWGLAPEAVAGDGIGDLIAACLAGVLALPDALALADGMPVAPGLSCQPPRLALITGASGTLIAPDAATRPDTWLHPSPHAPSSRRARFARALETLAAQGITHVLALGPMPDAPAPAQLTLLPTHGDPLATLARLYGAGAPIDWDSVFAGRPHRRVALPTYPFRRRRYWIDPPAAPMPDPDPWPGIERVLDRRAGQGPVDLNAAAYPAIWASLERLTIGHALAILRVGGAFAAAGERHSLDQVLAACAILPTHRRLVGRWLQRLAAHGLLAQDGQAYVAPAPLPAPDLPSLWAETEALLACNQPLLAYVRHCGALLADVLRGRLSPLETLFPGGSFDLAQGLYEHSATLRYINTLAAEAVGAFAGAASRPLRILEVGAGTGATTTALLPMLDATAAYTVSDVSEMFLDHMRARFAGGRADTAALSFRRFDMDRDPAGQGFEDAGFDLIVAANAVHASADLPATLAWLRRLLAPGGALMLIESTTDFAWFDMTTGLIEGWQHFTDPARRDQPLLTDAEWAGALTEAGFAAPRAWPEASSAAGALGQQLVIGRVPGTPAATGLPRVIARDAAHAGMPAAASTPAATQAAEDASARRGRIDAALPEERADLLRAFVRDQVMRVLRRPPDDPPGLREPLMDLGVDSLMAIQLRASLGAGLGLERPLPATLIFDHPTIAGLADLLLSRLAEPAIAAAAPVQPPQPAAPAAASADDILDAGAIAALSEADIEALLIARMEREPAG